MAVEQECCCCGCSQCSNASALLAAAAAAGVTCWGHGLGQPDQLLTLGGVKHTTSLGDTAAAAAAAAGQKNSSSSTRTSSHMTMFARINVAEF
jgi:hypothetical protein